MTTPLKTLADIERYFINHFDRCDVVERAESIGQLEAVPQPSEFRGITRNKITSGDLIDLQDFRKMVKEWLTKFREEDARIANGEKPSPEFVTWNWDIAELMAAEFFCEKVLGITWKDLQ